MENPHKMEIPLHSRIKAEQIAGFLSCLASLSTLQALGTGVTVERGMIAILKHELTGNVEYVSAVDLSTESIRKGTKG